MTLHQKTVSNIPVNVLGVSFNADFSSENIHKTYKASSKCMNSIESDSILPIKCLFLRQVPWLEVASSHSISLFRGLLTYSRDKLQYILNTLASIVTNSRKFAHVTFILKRVHWQSVE